MQHAKGTIWLAALALLPLAATAADNTVTNASWKNSLQVGATYKSGNTDKTFFTMNLKGNRTAPKSDWINSLYGEYGKTDGDQTEGQVRGQSNYRYKFGNEKLFGGVFGEAYYDGIKDIRPRVKLGPNVGYYFINQKKMKFDTSVGVNGVYERTSEDSHTFAELRLAAHYLWDFSETASYYMNVEYGINFEDIDDGNGLFVTGLKAKMNDKFSLYTELRDEYDNMPSGSDIDRNDLTIIAGIGYDF